MFTKIIIHVGKFCIKIQNLIVVIEKKLIRL
jgi:hypothetical protein